MRKRIWVYLAIVIFFGSLVFVNFFWKRSQPTTLPLKDFTIYAMDASGGVPVPHPGNHHCTMSDTLVDEIFGHPMTLNFNSPVGKGYRLGIGTLEDGTEIKMKVSIYGGFFYVVGQKGYYQLDEVRARKFDEFVHKCVTKSSMLPGTTKPAATTRALR
jgi:hypothetical protein